MHLFWLIPLSLRKVWLIGMAGALLEKRKWIGSGLMAMTTGVR